MKITRNKLASIIREALSCDMHMHESLEDLPSEGDNMPADTELTLSQAVTKAVSDAMTGVTPSDYEASQILDALKALNIELVKK